MILAEMLRGILRRWYIVLVGLLLAGGAAFAVWTIVPPGYERMAAVLLLPGEGTLPEGATNPYLYLGGLNTATDVVVGASSREVSLEAILEEVPGAEITIQRDGSTSAPVISIHVTGETAADAARAMDLLLVHVETTLADLQTQEEVPRSQRITTQQLYVDAESTVDQKNRIIMSGAVGGGVLFLSLIIAVVIDMLVLRSRRRRRWERRTGEVEGLTGDADDAITATQTPALEDAEKGAEDPEPENGSDHVGEAEGTSDVSSADASEDVHESEDASASDADRDTSLVGSSSP